MNPSISPTQFAWRVVAAGRPYEPPVPKRKGAARFGASSVCWLCGGATDGVGWPRELAIPVTFASHNTARCQTSDAVCQSCAALARAETWLDYVARHPGVVSKVWDKASWRSFSHFFQDKPTHHECPVPKRWRAILMDPPEPPFLLVISTSGQKNLIFRSRVAWSRDLLPVQFEETALVIRHADFTACLTAFEAVTALGFGRDQVLTGRYHHGQMLKAGIRAWRVAEDGIAPWRQRDPDMMALVHFCAVRLDDGASTKEPAR